MPVAIELLSTVVGALPKQAWQSVIDRLWQDFSAPTTAATADTEVVKRDRGITELDNVVSGSAWDLWESFDSTVPKASQKIIDFWNQTTSGKAVLILDGLSLREVTWLIEQVEDRGYKLHESGVRASELPAETTPFANSLGFNQRSSLDNNSAGSSHKLTGAFTATGDLPWRDCVKMIGAQSGVIFWHHWPDKRLHELSEPGAGLHKLAKETRDVLTSDDFWLFIDRLCTGRKLLIISDHGYAATGLFPDLIDKDQVNYMKTLFKSGRFTSEEKCDGSWVPPIDLRLTTVHGEHRYVLGRRKWKNAAGYPLLQHGGLSLLEVLVPFVIFSK